jgi:drug/metabolite transporter (DMT)-like permease
VVVAWNAYALQDRAPSPERLHNALRTRAIARLAPVQATWLALPSNVRGGIWILVASFFLSLMVALIKLAGLRLHVTEVLFFRQIVMLLLTSPAILNHFPGALRTQRFDLQILRVGIAFCAMLTWFTAVVHLPLAEATTIQFAKNFFVTLLAIFLLGEIVGVRRWAALVVGFVGVVIVAWPTPEHALNGYSLLAVVSAATVSVVMILVRKLSYVDPPITILTYQALGVGVLMLPPTIYFWQTPTLTELLLIAGIGIVSVIGQTCNILAIRAAEASALAPLDYSKLIYALALGYLMFSEWPEPRVFVGAFIIIAAAIYTLHRERVRGAASVQPTARREGKDL